MGVAYILSKLRQNIYRLSPLLSAGLGMWQFKYDLPGATHSKVDGKEAKPLFEVKGNYCLRINFRALSSGQNTMSS